MSPLDALLTDDFEFGLHRSTYNTMEWSVRQRPEYIDLEAAYYADEINDTDVGMFFSLIMRKYFHPGKAFKYEGALVALALLYDRFRCFYGQLYVHQLASLNSSELPFVTGVARQIAQRWPIAAQEPKKVTE